MYVWRHRPLPSFNGGAGEVNLSNFYGVIKRVANTADILCDLNFATGILIRHHILLLFAR